MKNDKPTMDLGDICPQNVIGRPTTSLRAFLDAEPRITAEQLAYLVDCHAMTITRLADRPHNVSMGLGMKLRAVTGISYKVLIGRPVDE